MAYRVADERLIAPHLYTEATGALATHETPDEELAVNERGAPQQAFLVLSKGDILYTSSEDYESISEDDFARATEVVYVKNSRYISEQENFGALEELNAEQQAEPKRAAAKSNKS